MPRAGPGLDGSRYSKSNPTTSWFAASEQTTRAASDWYRQAPIAQFVSVQLHPAHWIPATVAACILLHAKPGDGELLSTMWQLVVAASYLAKAYSGQSCGQIAESYMRVIPICSIGHLTCSWTCGVLHHILSWS